MCNNSSILKIDWRSLKDFFIINNICEVQNKYNKCNLGFQCQTNNPGIPYLQINSYIYK